VSGLVRRLGNSPTLWRLIIGAAVVVWIGAVAIQFIPYGHGKTNAPVVAEPAWDSPATRAFAVTACFDCHSNETEWPWYSYFAPVSWLVQRDVDQGRAVLNFSEWGQGEQEAEDAAEMYAEGRMPLSIYLFMNPDANFSEADRAAFYRGLVATFGGGE
jgi:hypothetical protein